MPSLTHTHSAGKIVKAKHTISIHLEQTVDCLQLQAHSLCLSDVKHGLTRAGKSDLCFRECRQHRENGISAEEKRGRTEGDCRVGKSHPRTAAVRWTN